MQRVRRWIERVGRLLPGSLTAVLARGASVFLVIQVVGLALSFGVHALLARVLGAETYGVYIYVYTWIVVLLLFARAGFATAALRFVSAYAATEKWALLRGFLRTAHAVVALSSAAVGVLTAAVVVLLDERLSEPIRITFLIACATIPVYAFLDIWVHMLRGFKRVFTSQFPRTILQPLLLGAGAGAIVLTSSQGLDAPRAMLLNLSSGVAAAVVAALALLRAAPPALRSASAVMETRQWLGVAAPLLVFNAFNVMNQHTDMLIVGALLGTEEAGVYAPARRIANLIPLGLTAVSAWAGPLIADHHARGDQRALQGLVRSTTRAAVALTVPLALGVLVFGRTLLGVFGEAFVAGYVPLAILAVGQIANAFVGPIGLLMAMTGRQQAAVAILGIHSALGLVLGFVLIPRYGIVGAAAGSAAVRVGWNLAMAVFVWRRMNLRVTIF